MKIKKNTQPNFQSHVKKWLSYIALINIKTNVNEQQLVVETTQSNQ